MIPPKPQSNIAKLNSLIQQLTPYLSGEAEHTIFTERRFAAQVDEFDEMFFRYVAKFYFLFSVDKTKEAIEIAEMVVDNNPSDVVTWGNYILCCMYKVGLSRALELSERAAECTNSPRFVRDCFYYARGLGDFGKFRMYMDKYSKMGKLDFELSDEDNAMLPLAVKQASKAAMSGKMDRIAEVGRLMNSMITPRRQMDAIANFYILDDGEEESFVFELTPPDASPDECGTKNVELIDYRIQAGFNDWSVIGLFTNEPSAAKDISCQ
jgi:tetratricopeptide (TPR) repeat protein